MEKSHRILIFTLINLALLLLSSLYLKLKGISSVKCEYFENNNSIVCVNLAVIQKRCEIILEDNRTISYFIKDRKEIKLNKKIVGWKCG